MKSFRWLSYFCKAEREMEEICRSQRVLETKLVLVEDTYNGLRENEERQVYWSFTWSRADLPSIAIRDLAILGCENQK